MPSEYMPKKLKDNAIIKKSNTIVRVEYPVLGRDPLTNIQQKIIMAAISLILKNEKGDHKQTAYSVSVQEFIELCGIDRKSIYNDIKEELSTVRGKGIQVKKIEKDHKTGELYEVDDDVNWFQKISYIKRKGQITFKFTEDILDYLTNGHYTWYYLKTAARLKGKYTPVLYEILRSWRKQGKVTYSLSHLKKLLGMQADEYHEYGQLNLRVLKPAITEINEKDNDITVSFKPNKDGKKVIGVTFNIKTLVGELDLFSEQQSEIDQGIKEIAATSNNELEIYLDQKTANQFIKKYGEEHCLKHLQSLKNEIANRARNNRPPIDNEGGWLRSAIEDGWKTSSEVRKGRKERAEKINRERDKQVVEQEDSDIKLQSEEFLNVLGISEELQKIIKS